MERKVKFKIGRETLRGSMFIPQGKGPFPSVIFFHGSSGNGEMHFDLAKSISKRGVLGFAFNYRGCGVSDGEFKDQTVGMGIKDGKAAIEFFLSQKEVDKKRLGFSGGSFGGFLASLFANRFNPKSVVLIASAAYSSEVYATHRDSDSDLRKDFEESNSYKEIAKFKGNLLVVSCELEDVLPPLMVEKYLESAQNASKKEKFTLRGSKHRISINLLERSTLIDKIKEWLLETL